LLTNLHNQSQKLPSLNFVNLGNTPLTFLESNPPGGIYFLKNFSDILRKTWSLQTVPIIATPEVGIPFPFDTTPEEIEDFREKAHAYFETIQDLIAQGANVEITDSDKALSHQILSEGRITKQATPGAIVNLEALLTEWDHEVLDVSRRLRNYVTNKLIVESADPDPRQRIKALELLGKVAGVNLFSERVDITVTHRQINDIETELRKTLELYGVDATVEDVVEKTPSIADIDLDEELGRVSGPETTD